MLVMVTVSSLWVGVPTATSSIAIDLTKRTEELGCPKEWERYLLPVCRVVAYLSIFTGWIIFSYLTVWLIGLVF
jgi:hypothetical protein